MDKHFLLTRLDEIGQSLAQSGHALALIGLGSAGEELERMDSYSDLDFFVIVEPGFKHTYIEDLSWLSKLAQLAYYFQNSADGYKLLFDDGIFCEFAVFELQELKTVCFSSGRIVWQRDDAPVDLHRSVNEPGPGVRKAKDYLIGETLTNLYVGLGRDKRGERLSATKFIQGYAIDRLVELADYIEDEQKIRRDLFANERRFEFRHPPLEKDLSFWLQGYERNRESALAILAFLEKHFEINQAIAKAIRDLCA